LTIYWEVKSWETDPGVSMETQSGPNMYSLYELFVNWYGY